MKTPLQKAIALICSALLIGCSVLNQDRDVVLGSFSLPNHYRILIKTNERSLHFEEGHYIYEYVVEGGVYAYRYWLNKELPKGQFECKIIRFNGVQHAFVSIKQSPQDPIIALNLETGKAFDTATGPVGVFGEIPEDMVSAFREIEPIEVIKDRSHPSLGLGNDS